MPKLKHIRASISTKYFQCPGCDLELSELFGFPERSYPTVTTFELEKLLVGCPPSTSALICLYGFFRCFPGLRSLTLGDCNSNSYYLYPMEYEYGFFPCDDEDEPVARHKFKHLKLCYDDEIVEPRGDYNFSPTQLLSDLRDAGTELKELVIVTDVPEYVRTARKFHDDVQWVTNESILD